jgi:glutathione-regulated potassium-efflux system ancillary protein KefF
MSDPARRPIPSTDSGPLDRRARVLVLVLVAHPQMEQSRLNRALMRAAASAAGPTAPVAIEVRDLYALYPDYVIDVDAERAALAPARLVVWQHPIHWYGMPPLMKLWADEVLGFGWAYGAGGTALRGKDVWLVTTTGGPQESYHPMSYNRYPFEAFLPPYEQTAALCGMRFLPPMVIHGAHRLSGEQIQAEAGLFAQRLLTYPDWPEIESAAACIACDVPSSARPPTDDVDSAAISADGPPAHREETGDRPR